MFAIYTYTLIFDFFDFFSLILALLAPHQNKNTHYDMNEVQISSPIVSRQYGQQKSNIHLK